MTNSPNTIRELAHELEDNGPMNPRDHLPFVRDLHRTLGHMASTDKVYAFYDEFPGLIERLSQPFLNSHVDDVDENPDFAGEAADLLEVGITVIKYFNAAMTEERLETIKEDRRYRGVYDRD